RSPAGNSTSWHGMACATSSAAGGVLHGCVNWLPTSSACLLRSAVVHDWSPSVGFVRLPFSPMLRICSRSSIVQVLKLTHMGVSPKNFFSFFLRAAVGGEKDLATTLGTIALLYCQPCLISCTISLYLLVLYGSF